MSSVKGHFADRRVNLTCFVETVFDLTGFDFLNSLGNVECNCACFRVRHEAFTTEQTAQFTDFAHHVRRSYADVEFKPALLDLVDHILIAYKIRASSFRFFRFFTFCKYKHALCFACAVRQDNNTTNSLVLFTRVYTQTNCCFNGFVEFGSCRLFHKLYSF
ncbi:hypothetical protein D3C72_1829850 [compost metagenome]